MLIKHGYAGCSTYICLHQAAHSISYVACHYGDIPFQTRKYAKLNSDANLAKPDAMDVIQETF